MKGKMLRLLAWIYFFVFVGIIMALALFFAIMVCVGVGWPGWATLGAVCLFFAALTAIVLTD